MASLLVVPWAIVSHSAADAPAVVDERALTLRAGAGFAASVAAIQLAEQALLNASVLTVSATATTALAGVVFNALLITRAPLQLFQSIQTSLLPHLSGLEATEGHEAFARAIRVTAAGHRRLRRRRGARAAAHRTVGDGRRLRPRLPLRARWGWPSSRSAWASTSARGRSTRPRWPAATRARRRRCGWSCAAIFVVWMVVPVIDDELVRAEIGYAGAAALLCALLRALYRR